MNKLQIVYSPSQWYTALCKVLRVLKTEDITQGLYFPRTSLGALIFKFNTFIRHQNYEKLMAESRIQ